MLAHFIERVFLKQFAVMVCMVFACGASAQPMNDLVEAEKAYHNGEYAKAEGIYRAIMNNGHISSGLYYNLGNCCFQQGDISCAILQYQRSLKLDPRDEDVKHNLDLARSKIPDRVLPVERFFLVEWLVTIRDLAGLTSWAILSVLLFWVFALLIGYRIWYGRDLMPFARVIAALSLAGCLAAFGFAMALRNSGTHHPMAVVMVDSRVYAAPSERSDEKLQIYAGETVGIIDSIDQLYKIELANTDQGWIPKGDLTKI